MSALEVPIVLVTTIRGNFRKAALKLVTVMYQSSRHPYLLLYFIIIK